MAFDVANQSVVVMTTLRHKVEQLLASYPAEKAAEMLAHMQKRFDTGNLKGTEIAQLMVNPHTLQHVGVHMFIEDSTGVVHIATSEKTDEGQWKFVLRNPGFTM